MTNSSDLASSGMGQTSAIHNSIHWPEYVDMIQRIIAKKQDPVLMDMGAGGGRDAIMMHDFAKAHDLNPLSIAVDMDANKLYDAQREFEGRFEQAANFMQVDQAHRRGKISYMVEQLPYLQTALSSQLTNPALPKVKIDFMLCNAVVMFIPKHRVGRSLQHMVDMLSPDRGGQLLLGFSTTRPAEFMHVKDQRYTSEQVDNILGRLKDIDEAIGKYELMDPPSSKHPNGRGFSWHFRLIKRSPA